MVLDVAVRGVDFCIEVPAFIARGVLEEFHLPGFFLADGDEPAFLFPARSHRWLSLTGFIGPVPFDPAQHAGCVGIWSVKPQHPLSASFDGEGR